MEKFLFALIDDLIWRLYLWRYVPNDLWYFDTNNGVTIVAHARLVENTERLLRTSNRYRGKLLQVYGSPHTYIFTDREVYYRKDGKRHGGYAMGTLQEFKYFALCFRMQKRALEVPAPGVLEKGGGTIGLLNEPVTFYQWLAVVRNIFC